MRARRRHAVLSRTAYVILGMLGLGRTTGYEIKQLSDLSTRFFWAASYGQIYPELKKLEQAGLIEGREAPRGGRRRTAYRLTAEGRSALQEWLVSDEGELELRDERLLKFFFCDALTTAEVIEHLRARRAYHRGQMERLREIEPVASAAPQRFPYLALQLGIDLHGWLLGWCEQMERQLVREQRAERRSAGSGRRRSGHTS